MILATNSSAWMVSTMTIALSIVLTIITLGIALSIGLILRRILVRRLKKTVLDNWFIQTLGVLIAIIPLIFAGFSIPLIWNPLLIFYYWYIFKLQFGISNLPIRDITAHLLETILLIVLGIGVARTMQRLIIHGLSENRIDINIRTLLGRIFYFIILTFVAFWILSLWGTSLTFPVAAIGVLTVVVTVSIQDIIKDLVAGFYILVERPFHIGDQISTVNVVPYVGRVEDIQLRATKLRLVSGEEVTIPNSLIFGSIVVNNTFYGERRATITATLPQEEYVKDETSDKILSAIKELINVTAKPEPTLFLSNYTASTVTMTIRFWINLGELSTVSDVMYTLHKTLPNAELVVKESAGDV